MSNGIGSNRICRPMYEVSSGARSLFSGLFTRVEIGHMRICSTGNDCTKSRGSWFKLQLPGFAANLLNTPNRDATRDSECGHLKFLELK